MIKHISKSKNNNWTLFWDMSSGGSQKLEWSKIYIQADEGEAKQIFEKEFDCNPDNVTCECCGSDYSISSSQSLEQLSGYHRRCEFVKNKYVDTKDSIPLVKYIEQKDVLVVYTQ
jgi:hypothetical protein